MVTAELRHDRIAPSATRLVDGCSAVGGAEPQGHPVEQIPLVVAHPGDVSVRAEQYRGHVQVLAVVDDMVDPVGPARHREPTGPVQQESTALVRQRVETPRFSVMSRIRRPSSSWPSPRS